MNEVTLLTAVTVFVLFGAKLINKSQPLFSACMRIYLDCWQSSDSEVEYFLFLLVHISFKQTGSY